MGLSRGAHKIERVTVTLVPTSDDRSFRHVPSTFSATNRTYGWRRAEQMDYMIVPVRISSNEIKVDLFVNTPKKGKLQSRNVQRVVQEFVKEKIESEWRGLKLAGISRPTVATPPQKSFVRGTIEEMLGSNLGN